MKINFKLEMPRSVAEARETQKGWNWCVELLVFLLVIFVVMIGESLIMTPVELALLFSNQANIEAIVSGDMNQYSEVIGGITRSDAYVTCSLFATIAMIVVTVLFCKVIQKRKMSSLGFVKKNILKEYGIGVLVGFVIFTIAVILCLVTGSIKLEMSSSFTLGVFLLYALGFIVQGMAEEVLCRSYLMVSVARRYPIWVAVILNSLFFALLHLQNPGIGILALVNLTLFGVFASVYFIKRGSIWGIAAIHSIWNFVQGNLYGIKVSGTESSCSVFSSVSAEGKTLINGGDFGLEGGLAVTVVLVIGILFLLTRRAKDAVSETVEAAVGEETKV